MFDECYRDNPLVNVLCLGVLPVERLVLAKAEGVDNVAVLLGSATGRDGIGGASVLASAGFSEGDEAKRPSVQVGDPYEEKRLIEACLELLDAGLAVGVQDLGAAGISCAASETAAKTGAGMDVDLARMPKREPGMNGVEVMTSESQERMLAIVTPENLDAVLDLCRRWEIRASVIGRVTDTARFRVYDGLFDAVGVPGENPPVPRGDDAARRVVGRAAGGRRAGRQPRRRSRVRPARAPRPPTAAALHADDPASVLARTVPRRHRPVGRAARAAGVADHRRQVVGVPPVRPPAVPQHRGRARRRRVGAAAEGHVARARAHHRRQGALLRARPATPARASP